MMETTRGKISAFLLAFLMATISMSATMQSWNFEVLESKSSMQTISSNSTINLSIGHATTIPTSLTGNSSSGTYEVSSEIEGMHFTSESIDSRGKVALGQDFICAIFADGNLKCWGDNQYGQLGIGSSGLGTEKNTPQTVDLGFGRTAISISAGTNNICAILDDGSLKCWGENTYGKLGIGSTTTQTTPQFVDLGVGRTAVSVSLGDSHTCAILDDGSLKCWGYNNNGQLGIGSTTQKMTPEIVNLGFGKSAIDVSLGYRHTCVILNDGNLKCWGDNALGQLGIGSTTQQITPQSVYLPVGRTAVSISAGEYHNCAVLDDGNLKCWGYNYNGQLGIDSTTQQSLPQSVNIGGGRSAISVSLGLRHTCVILDDFSLKCWGYNNYGQLGIGSTTQQKTPQNVNILGDFIPVSLILGTYNSCLISNDSSLNCWGDNSFNQFDPISSQTLTNPYNVGYNINTTAQQLFLGSSGLCVKLDNNVLKCVGSNNNGELGIGTNMPVNRLTTVNLGAGNTVDSMSLGPSHSCAILNDGSLKCWGYNVKGQLGTGDTNNRNTPSTTNLGIGKTAVSVSVGSQHTCAIINDGSLKCWGMNNYGQLGTNGYTSASTPQTAYIGSGKTAIAVSLGSMHTCAILNDGSLKCWGINTNGRLGTGSGASWVASPQTVNLGSGRTAISVISGESHSCALLDNGSVKCWGANNYGQLGVSVSQTSTPLLVDLGPGRTATSIYSGYSHTCAILDDSSLKCWGQNNNGQLGIGTTTNQNSPQLIDFEVGRTATSVILGGYSTCAFLDDGNLKCWGRSYLGTGSYQSLPQTIDIYKIIPYFTLQVPNPNSWYGVVDELGIFNLDVWYNTSVIDTFYRIEIDVSSPITYQHNNYNFTINQPSNITPLEVDCISCILSISPKLPSGMEFNSSTAIISGFANKLSRNKPYVISALNYSGISETHLSIKIVDEIPNINHSTNSINFIKGFRNQTNDLTNVGGAIVSSILYPNIDGFTTNNIGNENLLQSSFGSCGINSIALECWRINFGNSNVFYNQSAVTDFSLSTTNVCLVTINGIVKCAGDNSEDQINGSNLANSDYLQFVEVNHTGNLPVNQVATTQDQICVLDIDYNIFCQGSHEYHIDDSMAGSIIEIDSGEFHFCAKNSQMELYCWGDNTHSAIGSALISDSIPQIIDIGSGYNVIDYDAGEKHTCLVRNDYKILCWGTGTYGQIGDGYQITHTSPQMVYSPSWASYVKVSTGNSHTCAMLDDNGVMCWGDNSKGQLGDGTNTTRLTPVNASIIPSWMNVVDVVAGDGGTCVIDDLAAVWCWGDNSNQKLGLNSTISIATTPQPIRFSDSASLMGILPMGVLTGAPLISQPTTVHRLYGNNSGGSDDVNITITVGLAADYPITHLNLTRNTSVVNVSPVLTGGPYQFSIHPSLPPGMNLGINNGTIWGTPIDDQVSTIHTITVENNSGWDKVEINITVADILANISYPSSDYTFVRNWSIDPIYISNIAGGDLLSVNSDIDLPIGLELNTSVNTYDSAIASESGASHTCAILDDGSLKCWGDNNQGQLGIGSTTTKTTPQLVDLGVGRTAVSVSLGYRHTCVILNDGSLKCWGSNSLGQVGTGPIGWWTTSNTPQLVDLGVGRTAVSVSLGQLHTCAILDDSSLKCWGANNHGQLGITTTQSTPQLVDLGVGRTAVSVSLGQYYTCAILDDGSLKCWGYNLYDQLGIGSTTNLSENTPQLVDLGVGRIAVSVSLGADHTCAILDDSSLKCWGNNFYGQLGIGLTATTNKNTPQLVDLGIGITVVSVSLGADHTCAILDDSSLKCWGYNSYGQLGNGSLIDQTTPVYVEGFGQSIKLGKIYGTPTQTTPTQTYTFYGNNSVGSDTFNMDITVVPAYDYGNNTLVLTRNESMTARSPIITGGPYTVAISPPLPQGLNFEPSNGTIWGTPVSNQAPQTYVVSVSNSTGSDTIGLTVTIDDIAPFVTYNRYNETFVRGFNITTIEANQTGGNVQTIEANPALPQGIGFSNNANQVGFISGIPLIESEWIDYNIWTNNSIGSHANIISMRIVPAYDYGNNTLNLVRNETMSSRSPIITGGPYTSVSIQPSLPIGLFFEPNNGSIWGTPIFDQARTDYTIVVSNQYGSDSSTINIAISEIPPILAYDVSQMSYRRGFLSEHPVINLTGGAVTGFEISPALPAGLHFNTLSGIISGIPITTYSLTTHTIWANNSFGSSSWNINFEVLPGIDNSYNSIYLTRNTTMTPYNPTINIVERYLSIHPMLPDGLSFDYQTAAITGTPLIPWTSTQYSIRLWNSTGEDWLNFTLEVDEILPNIYYTSSNLNLYNNYGFEPLSPIGDAGYPENWAWNGSSVAGIHLSKYNSTDTISTSESTTCMVAADYRVLCWGANDMGQLGQGNTNSISNEVHVTLTSIHSPVDIAVGKHHTCVVTSGGEIECWGQNDFGQLGRGFSCAYGSYSNGCNGNFAVSSPGKVSYSGEFGFREVGVGDTHTCGILSNGTAMCWGSNSDGQLGEGSNTDSSVPVYVSSAQSKYFTQIDLGKAHSCATNYSGEIYCWGRNSFGQIGDGTIQNRPIPTMVNLPIGYSAVAVSSGGEHSCAILNGSQPACWGRNSQGQLGDGTLLGKLEPRIVQNPAWTGALRITAGEDQSCVVTLDHKVWCWGQSRAGMFSSTNSISISPVQLENTHGIGASLVTVGESHLCISTIRWSVMCSGDNQENQIPWASDVVVGELLEYRAMIVHVDHRIAGTIYGVPENGLGIAILDIAITNVAGTQYIQNTITVTDSFSYQISLIESTRGQSLIPNTPVLGGIGNAQFSVEPSLPNGLNIDFQNGVIDGTPLVNSTENQYLITFANLYGEDSVIISLVIYEPAADIVYPISDIVITRAGQPIQYAPTVSNGFVSQWSISPSLPTGLSFENGLISGQALVNQSITTYRVYGNNTGGVSFVDLTITVLEPVPQFTPLQSEYTVQRGDILPDIVVSNTGGNIALWNITPELPEGLEFINGRISGTPTVNMTSVEYTVRGENSGGFDEISFTLKVQEPAPIIQGQIGLLTATRDVQITELIIANTGGMAESWSILPDLPDGLIFNNGVVYGTPIVNSTVELFTITAVSEGGISQWSFYLEVLEPAPVFNYQILDYVLYKDAPFDAIKPSSSGGSIASYTITPIPPSGMFFDENRGILQGVPLVVSPEIQYTITAENSGGIYQQTISILILNQAPLFTLPYDSISLTEQVEMAKFSPFISSNIVVDSWVLEFEQGNQLPQGLVFDSTSGSIFGRPISVIPQINVTINATNDGGFYSLAFSLKVLSDYDGDTIPDELDEDDDNDGYSDKEEELKDSDPYDAQETPVEGFEIIIPNTEISLGAWDIIGMLTGIPLIIFLTFSLLTRNKRMRRFQDSLEMAKSREEISEIAERYEKALMLRLIGPHHGMRLERIRAETDDKLEEAERRFRYKLEEEQKEIEDKQESEQAQFYDKVDQTPLVEQSEDLVVEQAEEVGLGPQIDTEPTQIDSDGRQWYYGEEEMYWWRNSFDEEWQLLDTEQADAKTRQDGLKENKF